MTTSSYITEATFPPSPLAVSDYEPSFNGTELTTPDLGDDKKTMEQAFDSVVEDEGYGKRQGLGISMSKETVEPDPEPAALSPVTEATEESQETLNVLTRTPTLRRNTASYDLNSEIEISHQSAGPMMHQDMNPTTPLKLRGDANVGHVATPRMSAIDKPLPAVSKPSHDRLDAHGLRYLSVLSPPSTGGMTSPLGSKRPLKGIANKVTGLGKKLGDAAANTKMPKFGGDMRLPGTSGWSAPSITSMKARSSTFAMPAAAMPVEQQQQHNHQEEAVLPLSDDVLLRDELLGLSSAPCAVGGMIWTPMEVTLYPDSLAIGAANPEDERQNRVMMADMVDVLIVTMEEAQMRQLPVVESAEAQTFGPENLNMVILDIGMTDGGSKYLALPRARGVRWKSEIEMALAAQAAPTASKDVSTIAMPDVTIVATHAAVNPAPESPQHAVTKKIRDGRLQYFEGEGARDAALNPELVADIPLLSGSQEALARTSIPRAESTEMKMLSSPETRVSVPAPDAWSSPRQRTMSIGSPGPTPVPFRLPDPEPEVESPLDSVSGTGVESTANDAVTVEAAMADTFAPKSKSAAANQPSSGEVDAVLETPKKASKSGQEPAVAAQAITELRTMSGDILLKLDVVAKEQTSGGTAQQRHLTEIKDALPNILDKTTKAHQDLVARDDATKQQLNSLVTNQQQSLQKLGTINTTLEAVTESMTSLAPLAAVPEQVTAHFEIMLTCLRGCMRDSDVKYAAEIEALKLQNETLSRAIRTEMSAGFSALSAATDSTNSAMRDQTAGAIKDRFHEIMVAQVESDKKEADAIRDEINSLRATQRELEASIGELMQTKAKYERDTEVAKDAWQQAEKVRVVADAVARRAVTEITKAEAAASRVLPAPPMPAPSSPALRTVPPKPPKRSR